MTLAPAERVSARSKLRAFGAAHGRRVAFDVAAASLAVASIGTLDTQAPSDLDATALYLGVVAAMAWRALSAVAFLTASEIGWKCNVS